MKSVPIADLPIPRWVISDTHLGHSNILTYCPGRQTWAGDVHYHDAALIDGWNSVVGPEDWVLHLSDVAFGHFDQVSSYRKRLQGWICLVLGNHHWTRTSMHAAGFDVVVPGGEIRIGGDRWVCRYNPAEMTPEMVAGARRVLHGHCHSDSHRGTLPEHLRELAIDCGVDALRSVAPVPWDQIR
ncbi:MAG: hypothetical protein L6R48_06485 [Planctomycetes bacterium]|nr:hypothetical protein [Planctomycetota bacterium]